MSLNWIKTIVINLIVFCVLIIIVVIAFFELYYSKNFISLSYQGSPFVGPSNGTFTYNGQIGMPKEFSATIKTNANGWNDINHEIKKNKYRIGVLGDSFVEALQVNSDKNFARLLEKENNVEVITMGRSGWGQRNIYEWSLPEMIKYSPDEIIVFLFYHNDIFDNMRETEFYKQPKNSIRNTTFFTSNDYCNMIGIFVDNYHRKVIREDTNTSELDIYVKDSYLKKNYISAWNITLEYIIKIKKLINEKLPNTKFRILIMPSKESFFNCNANINKSCMINIESFPKKEYDWMLPYKYSLNMLSENNITVIDTLEYKKLLNGKIPHWIGDQHLNEVGHIWIKDIIETSVIGK